MIPSISLDFDDVAKRIDLFIETDYLFKLFEPEEVIEIIKRTKFDFQRFVTFIEHLRSYYDENIVIKILLEIKEVLMVDEKQNLEIIKIILETLDIPALTNIYSHIIKPKPKHLSLSKIISFEPSLDKEDLNKTIPNNEQFSITFGEFTFNGRMISKLPLLIRVSHQKNADKDATLFVNLQLKETDSETFESYVKSFTTHRNRITAKFILDHIKSRNIKIDFSKCIHELIAAGNLDGLQILYDNGIDLIDMAEKSFIFGHLHVIKYFLQKYPSLMAKREYFSNIAFNEDHYDVLDLFDNFNDGDFRPKTITASIKSAFRKHAPNTAVKWHAALIYNDMEFLKTLIYPSNIAVYRFLVFKVLHCDYKSLDILFQQNFIMKILTQKKKEKLMKYSFASSIETIQTVFKYLYEPDKYEYYNVLFDIWDYSKSTMFLSLYEKIKFSASDLLFIDRLATTDDVTRDVIRTILLGKLVSLLNEIPMVSVGCFDEEKFVKKISKPKLGYYDDDKEKTIFFMKCAAGIDITEDFPIDYHAVTSNDLDALCLACRSGNIDNVKYLIDEKKFDINEANFNGIRPVHIACKYGHHKIVQLLSDKGCDLHACNSEGHSVMDYAVVGGYPKIIKILLKKGIKINLKFSIAHGHFLSLLYLIKKDQISASDLPLEGDFFQFFL